VNRYSMDTDEDDAYQDPDGEWVLYDEAMGILKERDTLRVVVEDLIEAVVQARPPTLSKAADVVLEYALKRAEEALK